MKSEFAEIEMIGSRTERKAKEFSKEFDCKKYGTYEDVIKDKSVDVVYISTPIGTHEEWAIKNGYRDNDNLHASNTERIINNAKK